MKLKNLSPKIEALLYLVFNYVFSISIFWVCDLIELPLLESYLINSLYGIDILLIFLAIRAFANIKI